MGSAHDNKSTLSLQRHTVLKAKLISVFIRIVYGVTVSENDELCVVCHRHRFVKAWSQHTGSRVNDVSVNFALRVRRFGVEQTEIKNVSQLQIEVGSTCGCG